MILADKDLPSELPGVLYPHPDDRINCTEDKIQPVNKIDDVDNKSVGEGRAQVLYLKLML